MKILIAEDDFYERLLLESSLMDWGYDVVSVSDGIEAWEKLQGRESPSIAILKRRIQGFDGVEVCRMLRDSRKIPYIYIILFGDREGEKEYLKGMAAGADDYLINPYKDYELRARLAVGSRILEMQQALLEAHQDLRAQASHDQLTGLWSRPEIFDRPDRELARSHRSPADSDLSIVLADLDHFKEINDTYGHLIGDEVLRETARRMLSSVRNYDWIGRYGGEEVLIVLPGCDSAAAFKMAERIRISISREPIATTDGPIIVSISLGVTSSSSASSSDLNALIRAADSALYQAKKRGRNRVEMANLSV